MNKTSKKLKKTYKKFKKYPTELQKAKVEAEVYKENTKCDYKKNSQKLKIDLIVLIKSTTVATEEKRKKIQKQL